uniref:Uncharacterized protein n=1 Tax=Anguilla anguilla TaxID=7936 RepID=A0A0E9TMZ5_ANGAN
MGRLRPEHPPNRAHFKPVPYLLQHNLNLCKWAIYTIHQQG